MKTYDTTNKTVCQASARRPAQRLSTATLTDNRPIAVGQRIVQQGAETASSHTNQLRSAIQNSAAKAIQRYPVEVSLSGKSIVATSGRPCKRTNKPVQQAIIDDIFASGPKNDFEEALHNLGQANALYELRDNNWLSKNGAAICHKNSIDDVEETLVHYSNQVLKGTNTSSLDTEIGKWLDFLTQRGGYQAHARAFLQSIQNSALNSSVFTPQADIVRDAINNLIECVDASSANYYIGDGRTNSTIQNLPDSHYNLTVATDECPPTPISSGLYHSRRQIEACGGNGHLSPRRDTDSTGAKWVMNSGSGNGGKGWANIDSTTLI